MSTAPLLEVTDLVVEVDNGKRILPVLDGVTFSVDAGRTLGLVGESGCGKSMTALAIMGLLPQGFRVKSGDIKLDGKSLLSMGPDALRKLRGSVMSMVFQEPMTSLNPVFTVGDQIGEALRLHEHLNAADARTRAIEMLRAVQIPAPEERVDNYPHQLSGGMRQRVMIAMALACRPRLLICDEPTTALDVTVQAQIFSLLETLQKEMGTSIILITHDLGAVAEMADDVAVLYAGKRAEAGPVATILDNPSHPYTRGLMSCTPRLRLGSAALTPGHTLAEVRGMVPPLGQFEAGCRFSPRCPMADAHCHAAPPPDVHLGASQTVLCWKVTQEQAA
ncbi:ABC transporter ATP-binding protein [Devosia sp. XJ19-1]|uniref:ABC transporter ATP-binding protein n=1 Tax=Devosia ureilytica TaxID=2952754 RepID=A0A9Q4FQJ3_9HYPH|nr:ABC transporter ATP-binding protein [Devosia ureilytica]MCP8881938.1 ABC transporter ATP-binding protein [Devosia ureilytica]MCP8886176.1 ABC transporter ATP-binding protein [Devosia ureilytica]